MPAPLTKDDVMANSFRVIRQLVAMLLLTSVAASGCGPNSTQDGVAMTNLGRAYIDFEKAKGKGPENADEWAKWVRATGNEERAEEILRACSEGGTYVFYWGVSPSAVGDAANTVLGYPRDAPRQGGSIVFCDGHVSRRNAAEFANAKKPEQAPAK